MDQAMQDAATEQQTAATLLASGSYQPGATVPVRVSPDDPQTLIIT